jgi:hypothetical protein
MKMSKDWKKEIGYRKPTENKCRSCFYFRDKEDRFLDRSWIPSCLYAEKKYTKTIKTNGEFGIYYQIDPDGVCDNFKKKPKRCPLHGNPNHCKRRQCKNKNYDENCMEIV